MRACRNRCLLGFRLGCGKPTSCHRPSAERDPQRTPAAWRERLQRAGKLDDSSEFVEPGSASSEAIALRLGATSPPSLLTVLRRVFQLPVRGLMDFVEERRCPFGLWS